MKTTTNYALKKPEGTDVVNVQDFNVNSDIIDGKLKELETNEIYYAVATGTANNYAISVSAITSYYDGLAVCAKINIASTGASTININGLGAKGIYDSLGNPITSGGLKANTPYTLRYNGVNFILQGKGGGGNVTADKLLIGATATGDSGAIVGTMPDNGAINITPGMTAQTIPQGYTSGGTVAGDSNLITGNIKAGATVFGVAGKSSVVDTADGTTTADKILNTYTGYVNGAKVTGTMANNGAVTITPGGTAKTIPPGYHNGAGTVATDVNLVTGNIIAGKTIFGVAGKASVVETSSATATAGQMLSGATGYVNGNLITGTIPSKGTATINPSTTTQTISAGQYISGTQTIAPVTGSAQASQVLSGLTFSSSYGIGLTGTMTMASIGGRYYASGRLYSDYNTSGGWFTSVTLPFIPAVVIAKYNNTSYVHVALNQPSLLGLTTAVTWNALPNYEGGTSKSSTIYSRAINGYTGTPAIQITGAVVTMSFGSSNYYYDWIAYAQ